MLAAVGRVFGSRRAGHKKKSEESRQQVLDAAISVIAKAGIAGTTVQDIASEAGLSKGAVHYHFESKDELLERVLDRCCELMEARIVAVFESGGSPLERVRRVLAEMWRVRRDGIPEVRVLSELHVLARQNRRLRKSFADALERNRQQMISSGIDHLLAAGAKLRVSVDVVPRLVLASLDGLMLQHEISPITPETEREILHALETVTLALVEI